MAQSLNTAPLYKARQGNRETLTNRSKYIMSNISQWDGLRNVSEVRASSYKVGKRDRNQGRKTLQRKEIYNVSDLKLFFLIEVIVNNG